MPTSTCKILPLIIVKVLCSVHIFFFRESSNLLLSKEGSFFFSSVIVTYTCEHVDSFVDSDDGNTAVYIWSELVTCIYIWSR